MRHFGFENFLSLLGQGLVYSVKWEFVILKTIKFSLKKKNQIWARAAVCEQARKRPSSGGHAIRCAAGATATPVTCVLGMAPLAPPLLVLSCHGQQDRVSRACPSSATLPGGSQPKTSRIPCCVFTQSWGLSPKPVDMDIFEEDRLVALQNGPQFRCVCLLVTRF